MATEKPQFDVIVIGAGINGAGIARDAAMRGLKVLLLDKGDIGGGTSSWSTRLIHGGLRYLEHAEFRLVSESLRERARLMNIAPHLVRTLPILIPVYQKARRGWWTIRAGMIAYDALSFSKTLPKHRMLSLAETLQHSPGLNREGLRGAAVYFDAQVEFAERLVLENVLSAVKYGALVRTYAPVERLIVEDGAVRGVEFTRDAGTGPFDAGIRVMYGSHAEHHSAFAAIVINAAGPWVDQILTKSEPASPRLIGGTKGSHIVVAPFGHAPETAIYIEAEADGRPFFIIPWNDKYLIGTTDIRYEGDLDDVRIKGDEINYLLRETNRVLPTAKLSREQILYTYSGVRPLPFTENKDEQCITREHFIREHPHIRNLLSIVGGKLTTYRSLAEQTVDLIMQKLPLPGTPEPPSRLGKSMTTSERLPGAATDDFARFCDDFKQHSKLPAAISERLLRIYGTRAALILNLIKEGSSLAEVFDCETEALSGEVVFAFRHELATTLSDCLLRRTMVGLNSSCGLTCLEAAGAIMRSHLGWSANRVRQEAGAYRNYVEHFRLRN